MVNAVLSLSVPAVWLTKGDDDKIDGQVAGSISDNVRLGLGLDMVECGLVDFVDGVWLSVMVSAEMASFVGGDSILSNV